MVKLEFKGQPEAMGLLVVRVQLAQQVLMAQPVHKGRRATLVQPEQMRQVFKAQLVQLVSPEQTVPLVLVCKARLVAMV